MRKRVAECAAAAFGQILPTSLNPPVVRSSTTGPYRHSATHFASTGPLSLRLWAATAAAVGVGVEELNCQCHYVTDTADSVSGGGAPTPLSVRIT